MTLYSKSCRRSTKQLRIAGIVLMLASAGCQSWGAGAAELLGISNDDPAATLAASKTASCAATPNPAERGQTVKVVATSLRRSSTYEVHIEFGLDTGASTSEQRLSVTSDKAKRAEFSFAADDVGFARVGLYTFHHKHGLRLVTSCDLTVTATESCGDGVCSDSEGCASCAADCGVCPPICGDSLCEASEDCSSCVFDCGVCPPECGNGIVETGETCDPQSQCPTQCDDAQTCTSDFLTGASSTCDAECVNDPINNCVHGDGCCPSGCAVADDDDCTANPIAKGYLGPVGRFAPAGRIAEYGDLSAVLYNPYASHDKAVLLTDRQGNVAHIVLPGIHEDDQLYNAEPVFTSPNDYWMYSSDGGRMGISHAPPTMRHYVLAGDGVLPDQAVLAEERIYPPKTTNSGEGVALALLKLSSGALLAAHYEVVRIDPEKFLYDDTEITFVYRSPQGDWSIAGPAIVTALPWHGHSFSMAQHPVDHSIWGFSKGDSTRRIHAIHLTETDAGINVDWVDPNYITRLKDGLLGPNGELPKLAAVADPYRGSIRLAYQNDDDMIYSASPFTKGANVSIAEIDIDGSYTFEVFDTHIERVYGLGGITITSDGLSMAYRPVNVAALSSDDVFVSRLRAGVWEAPQYLGTTYFGPFLSRSSLIAYGVDRIHHYLNLADHEIKYFEFE